MYIELDGGDTVQENRDGGEERRNEFVDAAEKLFRENGIVDTTISSIVKEMNVAKGLFYYYFKSKDDVIDAISEKYNEVFNEMMNASMDHSDYPSRLRQFVSNTVASFRDLDNKLSTAEDVDLSQLSMRSIEEAKANAIDALTVLFEEGNEKDELMLVHPKYYADILISGVIELVSQKEAEDDEIKEIILDLIERAGKD
jgi:AcrR family transcriptional regulator